MVHSDVEFREIPGISNMYKAGSDGGIYSFYRKGLTKLSPGKSKKGDYYLVNVVLSNGRRASRNVHQLVCLAFHGEAPARHQVAHENGNGLDNRPGNLSWKTPRANYDDKFGHGTHDSGMNNSRAKLTSESLFVLRWLCSNMVMTHDQIADVIGVSRLLVTKVINGHRYGNVKVSVVGDLSDSCVSRISKV